MAYPQRNRRQPPPARPAPTSNGQAAPNYQQVTFAMATCSKCAALVPDTSEGRQVHSRFHDGLRTLWTRRGES